MACATLAGSSSMTLSQYLRPSVRVGDAMITLHFAKLSPHGAARVSPSIVVQDRAEAILLEQRIAAEAEQVEVERLVGLLLAVAVDFDGDRLRRLAGDEGQGAGLGAVVIVAGRGGTVQASGAAGGWSRVSPSSPSSLDGQRQRYRIAEDAVAVLGLGEQRVGAGR